MNSGIVKGDMLDKQLTDPPTSGEIGLAELREADYTVRVLDAHGID